MVDTGKATALAAIIGLAAMLGACGTDDAVTVAPTPPLGQQTVQSVTPCLEQVVPNTGGRRVVDLIVPDTITIDLNAPSVFPNGRRLQDPVIDITLAVALLDMRVHTPLTLHQIPLNPPSNDRTFITTLPYLAPPQGTPQLSGSDTATQFDFLNNPPGDYVRVDRMGMPAVSPALIGPSLRNTYNDAGPAEDAAFVFASELTTQLTTLTQVVLDEFETLRLTPCAATG